ncbi:MAG: alpha-L-rhamnosidase N-terminal domain-containing protein [Draconibacterium sp.]|nr:alpha-L-rhamnosidase N-terminal domain-containing protein [Draconibacterium sp.]
MKKLHLLLIATIFIISACQTKTQVGNNSNIWANAKWIAFEEFEDSMKIIPAVHGSGDELGEKGLKRAVVPMFRKEFNVGKTIQKATINITGLGHYDLQINGSKVGDHFLSPGWTNYLKRILYNSFDISYLLKNGENAIGVLVGNGFYNVNRERYRKLVVAYGYPKVIFNINIEYTDGSVQNIFSDENCRVLPSPVTFSSIYGGEDYDARLEKKGWSSANFDDSDWNSPIVLNDSMSNLELETDNPLKVMQEFSVHKIFKSKTGQTIYDFGKTLRE